MPDSLHNEPASHGYVRFKVKLKPGLPPGTQIKNSGAIFFDTNPAIITNTVLNTLTTPSVLTETIIQPQQISVYPNPATGRFMVVTGGMELPLEVYNVTGAHVHSGVSETEIDLSSLGSGLYLVKLVNGSAIVTRKILSRLIIFLDTRTQETQVPFDLASCVKTVLAAKPNWPRANYTFHLSSGQSFISQLPGWHGLDGSSCRLLPLPRYNLAMPFGISLEGHLFCLPLRIYRPS